MPGRNQTGPMGVGPLTGRGMGPCGDGTAQGNAMSRGFGRGGAFGCRRGYGRGLGYSAVPGAEDEREFLKRQKNALQEQLDNVSRRLTEWKDE